MSRNPLRVAALLVIAWLILLGVLSVRGFFSNFSVFPPRVSLAVLVPLPFVLLFARSRAARASLQRIPPQRLIYWQSFRILVEIGIWAQVRAGALPAQMSFEGRNFDILTGLLAIPVGYFCFVRKSWPPAVAVIYNIAGLVLLLNIVAITALNMPGVGHTQPDSSLVTRFPFIYLPGLLVPLAYSLHILSLRQIGMKKVALSVESALPPV